MAKRWQQGTKRKTQNAKRKTQNAESRKQRSCTKQTVILKPAKVLALSDNTLLQVCACACGMLQEAQGFAALASALAIALACPTWHKPTSRCCVMMKRCVCL